MKVKYKLAFIGLSILLGGLFILGLVIGVKREKNKHNNNASNVNIDGPSTNNGIADSIEHSAKLRELHQQYIDNSRQLRSDNERTTDVLREQCGTAISYIEQLRAVYKTNS